MTRTVSGGIAVSAGKSGWLAGEANTMCHHTRGLTTAGGLQGNVGRSGRLGSETVGSHLAATTDLPVIV